FAVPGHPLDPRAEGTNGLLKAGATLATDPHDVLSVLAPMLREAPAAIFAADGVAPAGGAKPATPATPAQALPLPDADRERLLAAPGPAPVDVDELGRATGLSPRAIQIALLELALAGRVERHGHQMVSRKA